MKKLLFTTSTLPRFIGDPEPRFVLDLARALSDRYEVTILAPADPDAHLVEHHDRVKIRRYRYAPLRCMEQLAYPGAILPRLRQRPWLWLTVPMLFLGLHLALRRLPSRQFDLVHCHWLIPQGVVQALAFWGAGMPPFVVTSHGGDLTSFSGPLMRRIFRLVISRAASITLVSKALLSEPIIGLATARVIPMGVDIDRFAPKFFDSRCFAAWSGDKPVLLFVGRLAEKKGVGVLLQAMVDQAVQAMDAHLILIGDGPLKADLKALRDALGLNGRVHFLAPVGHNQLPTIYASADVFCAPSVIAANGDTDGMPTVILEASACGTPCISTPVGGIAEFIEDGVNGLLVSPGDPKTLARAIARLLTNDTLRRRLGQAAVHSAGAYSWNVIADRFDALYSSVLTNNVREQKG
ncbi:MAG: glycosyltransferase [Proteobacteria bacterium]|nr:glycosyltransferase [Pseudomonadota bacterium]